MAKLTWKSKTYNGVSTSYARFTGELKAISSEPRTSESGNLFRNAVVSYEGQDIAGIMNEKNFEHGVNIGDKLMCEVSTTNGQDFYTNVSHLQGGASVDLETATNIFNFGGLVTDTVEAELELEESRD